MKQSLNEFESKQIYGTEQISKMIRWKQQSHFPLLFGGVGPQIYFSLQLSIFPRGQWDLQPQSRGLLLSWALVVTLP